MNLIQAIKMIFFGSQSEPPTAEIVFHKIPDGTYFVKYLDEKCLEGEYILGIFEVLLGEYAGKLIPMKFDNAKAKRTMRDRRGSRLEYLALGEGDKRALDLYNALLNSNGSFLIKLRDSHVISVPEPDQDTEDRYRRQLQT